MKRTIEIAQVDANSGLIIDRNIHLKTTSVEDNKDYTGDRVMIIQQDNIAVAMLSFKVDEEGNARDFKLHEIIQSGDGLTLSKETKI